MPVQFNVGSLLKKEGNERALPLTQSLRAMPRAAGPQYDGLG